MGSAIEDCKQTDWPPASRSGSRSSAAHARAGRSDAPFGHLLDALFPVTRSNSVVCRLARQLLIDEPQTAALGGGWQLEPERAARSDDRFDGERTLQQFREPARDRKTQTGAVLQLCLPELHELVEDPLLVLRRDALAVVDDFDRHAAGRRGRGDDFDRLAAAELDRVGDQVEENLPQPPRIGDDADRLVVAVLEGELRA